MENDLASNVKKNDLISIEEDRFKVIKAIPLKISEENIILKLKLKSINNKFVVERYFDFEDKLEIYKKKIKNSKPDYFNKLNGKNSQKKKRNEKVGRAYSSSPMWYDIRGFFILKLTYRSSLLYQIKLFSKNIGSNHLEVSVGSGTLLKFFLLWRKITCKKSPNIVAFDYAKSMLGGAIKRFFKNDNVNIYYEDVERLNFKSNYFDTINVANSAHCFYNFDKSFEEIYRVLKKNGTLCINVILYPRSRFNLSNRIANKINSWGSRKGILNRPYYKEEVSEKLEKLGFKFEYEKITGNCYNLIVRK